MGLIMWNFWKISNNTDSVDWVMLYSKRSLAQCS